MGNVCRGLCSNGHLSQYHKSQGYTYNVVAHDRENTVDIKSGLNLKTKKSKKI